MVNKLSFEGVEVGAEIPSLVKHPTARQLVKWAGASRDFSEIHYDKNYATARGLSEVIIQGLLKSAFLGQLMTDWLGEAGILKKLKTRYIVTDPPGPDLVCRGKVIKKYVEGGDYLVDCEVWIENTNGEKTTVGTATVILEN